MPFFYDFICRKMQKTVIRKLLKNVENTWLQEKYVLIYKYTKEKNGKGEMDMLNEEICKLRDKLNKSIENGDDYAITYKLSIELDELIAKYYRELKSGKKKLVIDLV